MIRSVAYAAARLLFGFAVVALIVTVLLGYAAWRAGRVAVAGRPPLAKRDAGFALLMAGVQFARTLPRPDLPTSTPSPSNLERIEP